MVPPPSLSGFTNSHDKNLKDKITYAIKQVEIQRKEVEQLRFRLDERRRVIFNATVRAIEQNDEMRARVLSGEHVELQKVTKMVNASELSLLHIAVRLETLRDVGDVMYALSNAFREVKKIGKSIENLAPNLEATAGEINDSFTNILAELGVLTPNISVALTDKPQEIFEKAQQLISERTSELADLPRSIQESEGTTILERTKKIALLATEGEESEEFRPTLLVGESSRTDPDLAIRNYVSETGTEKIDVLACSAQLNLPVDLVEQAYIKLLSERRQLTNEKSSY